MVRKTSSVSKAEFKGSWSGYIRCEMDNSAKEAFLIWAEDNPPDACFASLTDEMSAVGLKFGLSWNAAKGYWVASLTGQPESELVYRGWTLTAFGGVWERAIQILWYKHTQMLKGRWKGEIMVEGGYGKDFIG